MDRILGICNSAELCRIKRYISHPWWRNTICNFSMESLYVMHFFDRNFWQIFWRWEVWCAVRVREMVFMTDCMDRPTGFLGMESGRLDYGVLLCPPIQWHHFWQRGVFVAGEAITRIDSHVQTFSMSGRLPTVWSGGDEDMYVAMTTSFTLYLKACFWHS